MSAVPHQSIAHASRTGFTLLELLAGLVLLGLFSAMLIPAMNATMRSGGQNLESLSAAHTLSAGLASILTNQPSTRADLIALRDEVNARADFSAEFVDLIADAFVSTTSTTRVLRVTHTNAIGHRLATLLAVDENESGGE